MVNPGANIEKTDEASRDRMLDDSEVVRFWTATAKRPAIFRDIARLAMLTGQRENEVAKMEWSELNLGAATWDIAGERTKNKSKHHVPLSAPAVAILRPYAAARIADQDGPARLVFSNQPGIAISHMTFHTNMKHLRRDAKLDNFRFHDIRHTVSTKLAELGVEQNINSRRCSQTCS
jgi:integrase